MFVLSLRGGSRFFWGGGVHKFGQKPIKTYVDNTVCAAGSFWLQPPQMKNDENKKVSTELVRC